MDDPSKRILQEIIQVEFEIWLNGWKYQELCD